MARRIHAPVLAASPRLELAAVAEAEAADLALPPGVRRYRDFRELFADGDLEAVVVCLPPALHLPALEEAAAAGLPAYVEKPLVCDGDEAAALRRLAARHPEWPSAVGLNHRFDPGYTRLAAALGGGRAGEALLVRTLFTTAPREQPEWKGRPEKGGGVLQDLAVHHVDLAVHLFGRVVREVSARVAGEREERAHLDLALDGGVLVRGDFLHGTVDRDLWEIYGTGGAWRLDRLRSRRPVFTPVDRHGENARRLVAGLRGLAGDACRLLRLRREPVLHSYRVALEAFAALVRGEVPRVRLPTISDGLAAGAVVEAARRSARSGRPVAPETW